jgi:hypothetical protein
MKISAFADDEVGLLAHTARRHIMALCCRKGDEARWPKALYRRAVLGTELLCTESFPQSDGFFSRKSMGRVGEKLTC